MPPSPLPELHPDRLLPADPGLRTIARGAATTRSRDLPIISPHGHVPAHWLADDVPFEDPTSLLITPDHYVNRLLHATASRWPTSAWASGTARRGRSATPSACCARTGRSTAGTPVRFWFESAARRHLRHRPRARPRRTADAIYDRIAEAIATPEFRPRALYERSASSSSRRPTTPRTTCASTRRSPTDPTWDGQVVPTFRPDKYLEPATRDAWNADVDRLGEVGRRRHRHLRRLGRRHGEPSRVLQGARRGLLRPLPPRPGRRQARRRRGGAASTPRPAPVRSPTEEATPCAGTSSSSRPGWPPRTAWS